MSFSLANCKHAFICGAGHGIGLALAKSLLKSGVNVFATYRQKEKAQELFELNTQYKTQLISKELDPTNEDQIKDLANHLFVEENKLDLIFNSVGLLHNDRIQPEKSIKDFNSKNYLDVLYTNTVVTPLLVKYLLPHLNKSVMTSIVSLSARVGSISDNQIGGWYSYRASKTAMNMINKTIAIELRRKRMNCIVLSIHPGTTKTELSKPFIKNTSYQLHTPDQSADNILNVMEGKNLEDSGQFFSWDNKPISW